MYASLFDDASARDRVAELTAQKKLLEDQLPDIGPVVETNHGTMIAEMQQDSHRLLDDPDRHKRISS